MNASLLRNLKRERECKLSGVRRHDSPSHNTKHINSVVNQQANEIVAFAVTQVREAGNSNKMEKLNFTKALNGVEKKGICVNQLTNDRHTGIRKYMRESTNRK